MKSVLQTLVALAAFAIGGCATEPANPLDTLNGEFRSIYALARASSLAHGEPFLVVTFDAVVLHAAGKVTTERYTPPLYLQYKNVAHAVLAAFCLATISGDPLVAADVARIEHYLEVLAAAREHLAAAG